MPDTRVALFSSHSLFREGLARVLANVPNLTIVGQATTYEDMEKLASEQTVNVILAAQVENDPACMETIGRLLLLNGVRVITVNLDESTMQVYRREPVGEASVEALIAALTKPEP